MAYKSRIYLQRVPDSKPEYLGEVDLELRPARWGRTSFVHNGKREGGYIDSINPPAWESLGVAPTILVVKAAKPC